MNKTHCDSCDAVIVGLPAGDYFGVVWNVPMLGKGYALAASMTVNLRFTVDSSPVELCESCARTCFDRMERR